MKAAITLGIVGLIVIGTVLIVWIITRQTKAREDRRERHRHETFLRRLHQQAIQDSTVDPTSAALADEIANHLANTKETRLR